jgi:3-oxoacyl-(acyl-carrier-protein) synthase
MTTNDTSWEKPLKAFKTTSRVVDTHTELDALLRDTENAATRVSILDLSNLSGKKTKDEEELEKMLEEQENEERAKKIRAKMMNESSAAHAVSINTKTRGKRQSVKHYH